jgi:hypothetical protein
MNIEKIYNLLNNEFEPSAKRVELISYLKRCIEPLPSDDDERRSIAYNIAGLLSTNFAESIHNDDPINEVLILAGELETPDENNAQKWEELIKLVNKL